MLPEQVPHADAAANAGRAALLVRGADRARARPDLLLAATEDRLHQQYRRAGVPTVRRPGRTSCAAPGSRRRSAGPGPTVLALADAGRRRPGGSGWPGARFVTHVLAVDDAGAAVLPLDACHGRCARRSPSGRGPWPAAQC